MSVNTDEIQANIDKALSEEAEIEEVETEEVETEEIETEEAEPEYTESQLEAMDMGWRPDGKDKDGNSLTAEEYLSRKPLFNKIGNQKQKIDELTERLSSLDERVGTLTEQNKQIAAAKIKEREALLEQLKEAKESALENLDVDKVRHIDQQMDTVRNELSTTKAEPKTEDPKADEYPPEVQAAYSDFLEKNDWYEKDDGLAAVTDSIAKTYVERNMKNGVKVNADQVFNYAAEQVKELYPHKFATKQTRQTKIGSNQHRTPIETQKKSKTLSDLPEDQRAIALEVMEATGQSEDEYLSTYNF